MRKIFKKAIAAIAAVAMLIGAVATMPADEAKAAENVKLYFKISDPESYGCNVWGGATATGGDLVLTWTDGNQKHPSLIEADDLDGWGYITIDDVSKVQGLQVVKSDEALLNSDNSNNLWNGAIKTKGLTEAYFDSMSGKWYKEATLTTEIPMPTLDNIFYVVGESELTGEEWALKNPKGKMTEVSTGVYEVTFKNVPGRADDAYEFKIFQDPDDFAWEKVIWNDTYKKNDNMGVTVTEKSDVTFKVTVSGSNVSFTSVTVTKAQEETTTVKQEITTTVKQEATTTAKNEDTTTAKKEDTTTAVPPTTEATEKEVTVRVKLDSSLSWDTVMLYVWPEGGDAIKAWPGSALTKDGEYYTAKVTVPTGVQINMIVNNGAGGDGNQTADIKNVDLASGSVEIALAGDLTATVTPITGDSTPYVAIIATMLVLGCVVVMMNTKKANR